MHFDLQLINKLLICSIFLLIWLILAPIFTCKIFNLWSSSNHMLIQCQYVSPKLISWWGVFWCVRNTLDELLVQWSMMINGRFQRKIWKLLFYDITGSIWLTINNLVFNDIQSNLEFYFSLTLHRLSTWLKNCEAYFSCTVNNLQINVDCIQRWTNAKR